MKKTIFDRTSFDCHLGCFGNFRGESLICRKYCAICLRCAIESDQNTRMEILEELVFSDEISVILQ